jgi:hypothetical protein
MISSLFLRLFVVVQIHSFLCLVNLFFINGVYGFLINGLNGVCKAMYLLSLFFMDCHIYHRHEHGLLRSLRQETDFSWLSRKRLK